MVNSSLFRGRERKLKVKKKFSVCSGNAKSWLEAVIEHLMGRQGQPRGAQVHAKNLSDQNRWSQDPPLPRPHLRTGSGGKGVLLEIPLSCTGGLLEVSSSFPSFLYV